MNNLISIILVNKARITISSGAEIFSTRTGKSKVFSIPHSQIYARIKSGIKYNESYTEPATEYQITTWLYNKIKEYLDTMSDMDFQLVEKKQINN